MTRLVIAQLAAGSPPGLLLPWAREHRFDVDLVRPDLGDPLPALAGADGVVLVGADASVHDRWLGWLAPVRAWTAEALAVDVPMLGIALGAQLMAGVLGAEVLPAPSPEVGWVRVESDDPAVAAGPWLGYNEDAIVLPTAPWTTAYDARGTQAFRTGPHLGVQFHAHATPDVVRAWAANGRFAVPDGLAEEAEEHIVAMARNARALFSGWAAGAGLDAGPERATMRVGG